MAEKNNNNPKPEEISDEIGSSQQVELKKCPTQVVTVYNDRAEVTRTVSVVLPAKGNHEVVLQGLSQNVDKNSVRVSGGKGNAVILEVSVTSKMVSENSEPKGDGAKLRDERDDLKEQVARLQEALVRVDKEADFMKRWSDNALAAGLNPMVNENGTKLGNYLSTEAVKETNAFLEMYLTKVEAIDKKKASLNKEVQVIQKKLETINYALNQINQPNPVRERRDVTVALYSQEKTEVELNVSYLTTGCSWSPSYDCRVGTNDNSLQLTYYGNISNSSGEDWNNVQLNLSTSKPSAGGSPPKLPGTKVQYKVPVPYSSHSSYGGPVRMEEQMDQMLQVQTMAFAKPMAPSPRRASSAMSAPAPPEPIQVLTATASQGASSTTYTIPRRASIASDNKPHKVTIHMADDLKPRYTYSIIASKTSNAYLKVSAQNTSTDFQYLAGSINIFMDNNFVCTSSLKTVNPGEEFALFLGSDASIKIEYKPVQKTVENPGMLGKNKTMHVNCCTVVKNTKKVAVSVVVYDQVPLSSDDSIKFKMVKPVLKDTKDDIRINKHNNIEWRYTVAPGAKLEVPLSYDIEWPKDKEIEINEVSN